MTPKLFLRIAAVIMFLHVIGHTMGALTWKQAPNAAVAKVITSMETGHFDFMGRSVTLGKFFDGYGFINIFVLLFITFTLWIMSNQPNKQLIGLLTCLLAIQSMIEWVYFFPLPAVMSYVAAMCCALAIRKIKVLAAE